ncbi:MAG TPA: GAF domain-containing protein [Amnibacterium sp.]|jgi:hypothetical protein
MIELLLRPFARAFVTRVQAELDHVAHPTDPPQYHAPGPDPDRVLVFGNGPANGFGVRTQDLAMPGQIGRLLAAQTGRGADVDLVARRRTSVEVAPPMIARLRPERYDGIVVILGATDAAAFLPVSRWRAAMRGVLEEVTRRASPGTPIVVLGIYSLRRSTLTAGVLGRLVDRHARRLNAATKALCAEDPGLTYVDRDDEAVRGVQYRSAQAFQLLAEMIVPALVAGLDATAAGADNRSARAVRDTPAAEVARQSALDALDVLDTVPEERFDRIARSAKSTFGTAFAAISLLDRERQWHKAVAGPDDSPAELPREVALCHRTIRHDRPLVVADLRNDPLVHPDLLAAGWRFYAGYPIESPDGYRIGALCVLDTEPRSGRDVDTALLRDLALRAQREMWLRPDGSVRESLPR